MSLPASQQRALDEIEKTLADDHPGLEPLFATFTRLVGNEAMPGTEQVTIRPRRLPLQRRMGPTVAAVVGLAVAAVVLFTLSLTLPTRPACTGTVVSVAARIQSVPSGSQAACSTQPSEPSKTGPARAGATRATSGG
jgi:translation initiation factor 1 (eIF-1/SUI1)